MFSNPPTHRLAANPIDVFLIVPPIILFCPIVAWIVSVTQQMQDPNYAQVYSSQTIWILQKAVFKHYLLVHCHQIWNVNEIHPC